MGQGCLGCHASQHAVWHMRWWCSWEGILNTPEQRQKVGPAGEQQGAFACWYSSVTCLDVMGWSVQPGASVLHARGRAV
jgi:hypothetical protein